jgi:hypothetical protein
VIPKLLGVLIGVTLAALVLSLMGQITGQSLLSQSPSAGGPASTKSVSPRDADRATPRQHETSRPRQRETSGPSEATGTASRAPGASTPTNETGAPPNAGTGQGASGGRPARPSPSASAPSNQVARSLSPEAATPKATPFGGSHRAELVRKPVSRGRGDSYAVRLLDPAGKALVVAEIFLVVHMADGTVQNIAMGALPEPGTYRATVPTGRSTPVDLRVRVSTGDRFVEVPVRP